MVKKIILKNGLRIILAPQPGSLTATVLVLVEAGSEYETKNINGLSHFLEHMTFKGTMKRPRVGMIAEELDSLGSEYNAFTGQEFTGYWAKAESHKIMEILDIVSDLYLNPIFNPREIEKERGVVIEEINMFEDTPMRKVHDLFLNLLYGDQPAGWDIVGRKEIIRRLQREDFLKYRAEHYLPQSTVVVIAGNFNHQKIADAAKKIFEALKRRAKTGRRKTVERQKKPALLLKFKESDQSHLVLGARAFDIFDKRRYALQLLGEVLGGGMSSRLFHRIREEMGAAYYVRAGSELFLDHGYFAVSAGVDNRRIEEVVKAALRELERIKKEQVSTAELGKAKEHFVGNFILGLESSDELAGFYGGQEILTRKLLEPEEIIKNIRKVTAAEIRNAARSIFRDEKLNFALIAPRKETVKLRKVLKFEG